MPQSSAPQPWFGRICNNKGASVEAPLFSHWLLAISYWLWVVESTTFFCTQNVRRLFCVLFCRQNVLEMVHHVESPAMDSTKTYSHCWAFRDVQQTCSPFNLRTHLSSEWCSYNARRDWRRWAVLRRTAHC